uniref:1-phosphatidylinositol-3-phosphate 5-kinase n=3 Tax=Auxenochlorella protothecoides TaxID=3075 RepID=A0A1D1ZQN6_AUXPR
MSSDDHIPEERRSPALTWDIPEIDSSETLQKGAPITAELNKIAVDHLTTLLGVQLSAVLQPERVVEWLPVIWRLADAAASSLSPSAVTAHGDLNPRNYVEVLLLHGEFAPEDSEIVAGVCLLKNVAHKRMPISAQHPRIMLLSGALQYKADTLSSLDSVLQQEEDYLQKIVQHIVSFKPTILLVEKTVSRSAQDMFLEHGIALVLNVSLAALERLAMCMGAEVAEDVNTLSGRNVGFCKDFAVSTWIETSDSGGAAATPASYQPGQALVPMGKQQSLMSFDGCPRPLGVTVLLRGASIEELNKVTTILKDYIFASYWNRLEVAFLTSQFLAAVAAAPSDPQSSVGDLEEAVTLAAKACRARQQVQHGAWSPSPFISFYAPPDSMYDSAAPVSAAAVSSRAPGARPLASSQHKSSSAAPATLVDVPQSILVDVGLDAENEQRLSPEDAIATPGNFTSTEPVLGALSLTIMCKNPSKGVMCEAPHAISMPFYRDADVPLGAFMAHAAPVGQRCPHPECGEGAFVHLRNFMHGDSMVTLSCIRLGEGKQLPDDRLWIWLRPLQQASDTDTHRVALDADAACISFAHFMTLLLDVRHLELGGTDLQTDYVRYIGSRSVILCLHYTRATPYTIQMPSLPLDWQSDLELRWLQEELKDFTETADEHLSNLEAAVEEFWRTLQIDKQGHATWQQALKKTRRCLLRLGKNVHSHIVALNTQLPSDTILSPLVWEINYAKRVSELCHKAWSERLERLQQKTAFAKTSKEPPAAEIPQLGATGKSPSSENLGRSLEASKDSPPRHQRGHSASLAEQFAQMYVRSPANMDATSKFATPFLNSDAALSEASELGERDNVIIPTGLVARYVAKFQESSLQQSPHPSINSAALEVHSNTGAGAHMSRRKSMLTNVEVARPQRSSTAEIKEVLGNVGDDPVETLLAEIEALPGPAPISESPVESAASPTEAASHFELWADLLPDEKTTSAAPKPASPNDKTSGATEDATFNPEPFSRLPLPPSKTGRVSQLRLRQGFKTEGVSTLAADDGHYITVYEDEPTSCVAYALSTRAYTQYVQAATGEILAATTGNLEDLASPTSEGLLQEHYSPSTDISVLQCDEQLDCKISVDTALNTSSGMEVLAYFAPQFAALRSLCVFGGEQSFLTSISRCQKWESKGGKSNVYFAKTKDDRFIVKELSRLEKQSFLESGPTFLRYWGTAQATGTSTSLAKILGVYQVTLKSDRQATIGKSETIDFLIMENIFYGCDIHRIYDLKGSERDRYVAQGASTRGTVLLDQNLKEISLNNPLSITPASFEHLKGVLQEDTEFLANQDVMDYSLLIGVDKNRRQLVIGVIDFIRQFTLDKALEMYVKKSGLLGGGGKEPTIISPKQYANRFRLAMAKWLVSVPTGTESCTS